MPGLITSKPLPRLRVFWYHAGMDTLLEAMLESPDLPKQIEKLNQRLADEHARRGCGAQDAIRRVDADQEARGNGRSPAVRAGRARLAVDRRGPSACSITRAGS